MIIKKDSITGISYEILGNEKSINTLLFIHGAGGNKMALKALANQFIEYKCVLVDLPGHYLSDGDIPTNVEGYAAVLGQFLQSRRHEMGDNITCIGHSLGGMISLELAIQRFPQIEKLVILNSGAKMEFDQKFMKKIRNGKTDKLFLFKAGGSYFNFRTYQFFLQSFKQMIASDKVMQADFKIAEQFDRREAVKKINLPTLIATGEKEILATTEVARYLHAQIPNSRLLILKGLSHLMPVIAPELLARKIKTFLEG